METWKTKIRDAYAYLQGNFRYRLYYSRYFGFLLPDYIYEQISYRLFIMRNECYIQGACVLCGCETPHLQMADKACKGKCYPPMLKEMVWEKYKVEKELGFMFNRKK